MHSGPGDDRVPVASASWLKSIGFGLERIAWLAIAWPRAAAAVFLVILAIAGYGITRLAFDDDMRNVFSSSTAAYDDYVKATADFVDPENETLILVEGDRLGEPGNFRRLQDFQLELQLADGIDTVFSLFALREPPSETGEAPLLVNDTAGGLTPALLQRIRAHPILGAKLLAADGRALVYVVTPSQQKAPLSVARVLQTEIEATATRIFAGSGLTTTVTGFPTIRVGIVDVLKRDQLVLNGAGAMIGFLMSLIAFRSVIAAILTATPAVLGGLIVLGFMGLLGVKVTVMSTVIPALVMILGYADGMHLSHAWRHHRDRGETPAKAELSAQMEVGAACVLTAITIAAAFLSLTITDIAIIRSFAWTGAAAMLLGCAVVLVGHALTALLLGKYWKARAGGARNVLTWFEAPCERLGRFVVARARALGLISAGFFVVFGAMYWAVPAEHSIREHLPTSNPANGALGRFDRNFGGAFPIEIVVPLGGQSPTSPEAIAKIAAVHRAVIAIEGVKTPLSLWSLVEWLGGGADAATGTRLDAALDALTPATRSRFVGASGSALVTVSSEEAPTYRTEMLLQAIEAAAAKAGGPGTKVTGVTLVTTREAARTISNLNVSLATAVFGDIFIIILAFRSLPIGVVACLANTLPLLVVGALLFLTGRGMQMTGVIALTVAFGIAVDDTIHYLNRLLVHTDRRRSIGERLVQASREVGPVLIGTTLIVVAGLSTTLTSGLPTITLFGAIAAITLVVAMAGDLIVMPALIQGYGRRWFETKTAAEPARVAAGE